MMSFINSNPICAIYHSSGKVNRDRKSKKIAPYEPITLLLFLICAPMSIWLIFMISVIILRYDKLVLRFCSHITSVCIGSFYLQWWFSFKHLNVKKNWQFIIIILNCERVRVPIRQKPRYKVSLLISSHHLKNAQKFQMEKLYFFFIFSKIKWRNFNLFFFWNGKKKKVKRFCYRNVLILKIAQLLYFGTVHQLKRPIYVAQIEFSIRTVIHLFRVDNYRPWYLRHLHNLNKKKSKQIEWITFTEIWTRK